jgi:hypothetical protein
MHIFMIVKYRYYSMETSSECCTHWGLKRWCYGIKEYVIDRCLCCANDFDEMDDSRAFKEIYKNRTTDCFCIYLTHNISYCYNNPITGTLCLPFGILVHLLCIPYVCCSPNKDGCYGTNEKQQLLDAEWRKQKNITAEEGYYMKLNCGLDDKTHLANCTGYRGNGIIIKDLCQHPVHKNQGYFR